MKTTLREIVELDPCSSGITKLLNNLGYNCGIDAWEDFYDDLTDDQKDKPIDFVFLLDVLGVKDTFWCLSTQPEKINMEISADIAESVLYIFEKNYPNNATCRDLITSIRGYCNDKITKKQLKKLKTIIIDISCTDVAAYAAYNAAYTAHAAADATTYTAADVATDAVYTATSNYNAKKNQWEINKKILLKYI